MDRVVALKVIHARLLDSPRAVERFQREVRAAARLEHPNIVRAYDADEAGATHFLVMEFVPGTDLARYVGEKGALSVAEACHFVRQAALGLDHAHQQGLVHRDIKPHNLLLVRPSDPAGPGLVKVMDFGLARLGWDQSSDAGLTGDHALMGTLDYMAPEQAEDAHGVDIRADIYSLGCTLYHLLAGRPLLAGASATRKLSAHLMGKLPLADLPAAVPAELRAVLAKMVAREPARRYQTPAEVAAALLPFLDGASRSNPAPESAWPDAGEDEHTVAEEPGALIQERPARRRRRWSWRAWVGGGVPVVLLFVTGFVLQLYMGSSPRERVADCALPLPPPEALSTAYANSLGMKFVLVPKGMAWLGGSAASREADIPYDFYLGKYEVTQGDWARVMDSRPSFFSRNGANKGAVKDITDEDLQRFPVEGVSWEDAQRFLERLNRLDPQEGWAYRLPREAEWEYACRGGPIDKAASAFNYYLDRPALKLLPGQANFEDGNGLKRPCPVGSYWPNALGLHDMHGNVHEWCDDAERQADGSERRVIRGGSWDNAAEFCQATSRSVNPPGARSYTVGLRVARVPAGK
jgi:formylglycine-generating enzyme required for sulfatase activity/tRNA A-37 threonylcarbamoyl transferase component Bud32